MMKIAAIASVFLGLTLASPSRADFKEGWAAYKRGEFGTARDEFLASSKKGHATAAYYLGVMYGKGLGVQKDHAEAVKWYRKAAAAGHASAMYSLGRMYESGRGVPLNRAAAAKWYKAATAAEPFKGRNKKR